MSTPTHVLSQLRALEAESIHIFREVAAEMQRPCLLFSGGKDSIVMLHVARKAFAPSRIPFPVMHVDTGLNFPEILAYRDSWIEKLGLKLVVASVPDAIERGLVREEPNGSRNRIQTPVLLEAAEKHGFDALFGGGRRDEEKARAKERVFSFRDEFGQWDPKNQRPEIWNLYNGKVHLGQSIRVFPLSNWTELDIWTYIAEEGIEIPELYLAKEREVVERAGMLYAVNEFTPAARRRDRAPRGVPLSHGRRRQPHGGRRVGRGQRGEDRRGDLDRPDHRARRDPGRRQDQRDLDGRPQEGRLLLMPMDLLRFATAGSVDDGKSTLIGRLLYDSKSLFSDQLEAVERVSLDRGNDYTDLALLTDGLRAEREQGITIDVAYRYFATPRRKFIIADTPGHIQYTRNMVTGASTADVALILLDARKGITEQSRRHAFLATLLGVPHVAVCVNKMDLVDYSESVFEQIRDEFSEFATRLRVRDMTFIPVSALKGDNVVVRSEAMPWYEGSTLLSHLERLHVASDRNFVDVRFPVQYVIRPQSREVIDYRGYAGTVASGVLKAGDRVVALPSGLESEIASIDTADGPVEEAYAPMAVTIVLRDELDISRGDMICRPHNMPTVSQDIDAQVCWMDETAALVPGRKYGIKHTTRWARAMVKELSYRIDVNTLHRDEEAPELSLNEIGRVQLRVTQPLFVDPYQQNRQTGSFILVDEATNKTVAAGMIGRTHIGG